MYYVSTNDIECIIEEITKKDNSKIKKNKKNTLIPNKRYIVDNLYASCFEKNKLDIKYHKLYNINEYKLVNYIFEKFINDINNIIFEINKNYKIFEKKMVNEPTKFTDEYYINYLLTKKLLNFKNHLINLKFRILVSKLLFLRVYKTYGTIQYISVGYYHKIKLREYIAEECNNICQTCGYELDDDCTYEHIIPVSEGGATSYENGTVVHSSCNKYLGTLDEARKRRMLMDRDNDDFADDFDYDFVDDFYDDY